MMSQKTDRLLTLLKKTSFITAAGGNGTAIQTIDQPLTRTQYASYGKALGKEMEQYGAEQVGFLLPRQFHFEMAGGEFCGNASRAAAILFSEFMNSQNVTFTVSGFSSTVNANVIKQSPTLYTVRCSFPDMPITMKAVTLTTDQLAYSVDLEGIVHIVIEGKFPKQPSVYQSIHKTIIKQFQLDKREAVGVIWFERSRGSVVIHPVVWVKAVNTFFYENSCGSGSIAVSRVTGTAKIVQPTGKIITVTTTPKIITLESEMELIYSSI